MKAVYMILTLSIVLLNCLTKDLCNGEFRAVRIKTYNSSGPVVLDSAYTIRTSTNERFQNPSPMSSQGWYNVLDDSQQHLVEGKQENFSFRGFKGGVQVVNEAFVISGDECHVTKVSGKDSVLVQ